LRSKPTFLPKVSAGLEYCLIRLLNVLNFILLVVFS
jgi:hypothetical protein